MFIRHSEGCLFVLSSSHALGTETLSASTAGCPIHSRFVRMSGIHYEFESSVVGKVRKSPHNEKRVVWGTRQAEKRAWWRLNHGGRQSEERHLGYIRRFVV